MVRSVVECTEQIACQQQPASIIDEIAPPMTWALHVTWCVLQSGICM